MELKHINDNKTQLKKEGTNMERRLFNIEYCLSEEAGIFAVAKIRGEIIEDFKEVFKVDLRDVLQNKKVKNKINGIVDIIEKEIENNIEKEEEEQCKIN